MKIYINNMTTQTLLHLLLMACGIYYTIKMLNNADKGNLAGTVGYAVMIFITFLAFK